MARDEREAGDRALLNLGHTFGHALEAATGFSDRLFHGEGVAIGMVLAAELSAQLDMISEADAARIERHAEDVIGEFGIGELRDFKAIWDTQTGEFTTKARRMQRKGNGENQ